MLVVFLCLSKSCVVVVMDIFCTQKNKKIIEKIVEKKKEQFSLFFERQSQSINNQNRLSSSSCRSF